MHATTVARLVTLPQSWQRASSLSKYRLFELAELLHSSQRGPWYPRAQYPSPSLPASPPPRHGLQSPLDLQRMVCSVAFE